MKRLSTASLVSLAVVSCLLVRLAAAEDKKRAGSR